MRAVCLDGGFGLDRLQVRKRSTPACAPGQVLLRMRAASLNYRDLMMVRGEYNPHQPLPLIPLSDGVGEVMELGPGCSRFSIGQRVAGLFAQEWHAGPLTLEARASTLGGPKDGMWAEERVLPESGLVAVPGYLSDEEAACLPCAALTAWNALMEQGRLRAGERVLLLGTGGVSLFALLFAKMAGAQVCITSSSDAKLARAEELGADYTINYREHEGWGRMARKWAGGGGVDHVVEVGGGATLAQSLEALKPEGGVYVIGVLGGVAAKIPLTSILMKQAHVHGVFVGHRAMFEAMGRAMTDHHIHPVIDRVFGFEQAREAFEYLQGATHFGKVVVRLNGNQEEV